MNEQINTDPGFDIVIGNPPYEAILEDKNILKKIYKKTSVGTIDSYKYFIQMRLQLKKEKGLLSYITSDSYLEKENFSDVRELLISTVQVLRNIKLGDDIFGVVKIPTSIFLADGNNKSQKEANVISANVAFLPIEECTKK